MLFSSTDLEQACKEYEAQFNGGKICVGVRDMLRGLHGGKVLGDDKVLGGGANTPPKTNTQTFVPVHTEKPTLHSEAPAASTPKAFKNPTYMELLHQLNDETPLIQDYLNRRHLYYRLMHQFGFLKSDGQVAKPWSAMPWHCDAWQMVLMDYCSLFMKQTVIKYNPLTMLQYLIQIRQIISSYELLENLPFDYLRAVESKFWHAWMKKFN